MPPPDVDAVVFSCYVDVAITFDVVVNKIDVLSLGMLMLMLIMLLWRVMLLMLFIMLLLGLVTLMLQWLFDADFLWLVILIL